MFWMTESRPSSIWRRAFSIGLVAGALGVILAGPREVSLARDEPPTPRQFAPGVAIDWHAPAVHVDTHVVLRAGPLEFLACFAGKEHESILRFDCTAVHLYQALGLIGLEAGRPPTWNPRTGAYQDPTGALVTIELQAERADAACDASAWLRKLEHQRTPIARPWVFAGSRRLADGTLSADRTGVGVALVDFEDSLIAYSRRFPSDYAALWVEANPTPIPPEDTRVTMVIRAARPQPLRIHLDARSVAWVDGQYCTWPDLVDLLKLQRRLAPIGVQTILLEGVFASDRARLEQALHAGGVDPAGYRLGA